MQKIALICAVLLISSGGGWAAPRIVCEAPKFDFGVRRDTETVKHRFVVKNTGDAPLNITRVKASCGCTAVKSSTNSIAPGMSATIDARFTLRGRRGKQQKSIIVDSNDPQRPRYRLYLKGEIVVEVALEPRYINFRQVHKDRVVTQNVALVSLRPDVRITDVKCSTPAFDATINPDGRGLTVRTVPPLTEGLVRGLMTVTTDHPKGLTAALNIVGVAVGDLIVMPRELALRKSWPDPRHLALIVRSFTRLPFKITRVETPLPSINATVVKQPDGNVRVDLKGIRPEQTLQDKAIIIHTDLDSTPVLRVPIKIRP